MRYEPQTGNHWTIEYWNYDNQYCIRFKGLMAVRRNITEMRRAKGHAVSRILLTAEARVRSSAVQVKLAVDQVAQG
jgi:hypothetical protein